MFNGIGLTPNIIIFTICGILVILASIYISYLLDIFEEKSKKSSSILGGIFLGWVSSLPELILMFVFLFNYSDEAGGASNVNVIIADILGGNILNMAALCFIIVLFIKNIKYIKSGVTEFVNIGSLVVINILFILGIFCKGAIMLGTINIISLFVLLIYVINIFFMVKDKKTKQFENNIKTKLSKKQLGWLILVVGFVLVILSLVLSFASESVIELGNIHSDGAALMLGIVSSTPEIVTTFALIKLKNFNGGISAMFGSCLANRTILVIADIIYNKNLYESPDEGLKVLTILVFFSCLFLATSIILINLLNKKFIDKKWYKPTIGSILTLAPATYVGFGIYAFLAK